MIECDPAACVEIAQTQKEMLTVGIAATVYLFVGLFVAYTTQVMVNDAVAEMGQNPASWGLYVSVMLTLLWPVFVILAALTTGYATLTEVSE